ncbi:FAD-binding oxidoreductase [Microbacterium sp.]|uniref:FAD-binding oxidoreductase n=1 Tax=Microbacterium sp. TaxID=51671 RepID=UPI003C72D86E
MREPADLNSLRDQLSTGALTTDADIMASFLQDHAERPLPGSALALVRARDEEDVRTTMRWASSRAIPVVIRGAGSGLSGGSTAVDGCLQLSLDRMRDIRIDPATRTAHVQPGALNADVKSAAAAHGLAYPPDPASTAFCSIGGNVATNAGGLCCVKYGVTGDYVLGLNVVLADGRRLSLGGDRIKDSAGLSLTKLFVGSEGILGVITEVILRLVPAPARPGSLVATFADVVDAMRTVEAITAVLRPSMLEFMDRTTIRAVEDVTHMGLDLDAEAMLIIQSDSAGSLAAEELTQMESLCNEHGATECVMTDDPDDGDAFVAARRTAVTAVERKGAILLEDAGVPIPRLAQLASGIQRISVDRNVAVALIAHAGDGNTHPMILFDREDPATFERAQRAFDDIMALTISLGGTITGEHGVGKLKQPWLPRQLGSEVMTLTRELKAALDPQSILNPGVIVA